MSKKIIIKPKNRFNATVLITFYILSWINVGIYTNVYNIPLRTNIQLLLKLGSYTRLFTIYISAWWYFIVICVFDDILILYIRDASFATKWKMERKCGWWTHVPLGFCRQQFWRARCVKYRMWNIFFCCYFFSSSYINIFS